MASVREKLLPVVAKLRGVADTKLGLRRYTVYLRRQALSDLRGGIGSEETNTDTLLVEKPRIREASSRDIVSAGGRIEMGDLLMDRVTPQDEAATVGVALSTLEREPTAGGQQVLVVLVGPGMPAYVAAGAGGPGTPPRGGGEFTLVGGDASRNFEYSFVLRPRTGRR